MRKIISGLVFSFLSFCSVAQSSNIDTTLNTNDLGNGYNQGASPTEVAVQSDGKIIVAAGSHNYVPLNGLARLNADGSIDPTFNSGTGIIGGSVKALVIQTDGKILAAGSFTFYNGTAVNGLVRINTDGTIDATYNSGTGATGGLGIWDMVMQTDNKVIIVGAFTAYNGTARKSIARVNTNGTVDATFNPGTGPNTSIAEIGIGVDNKVVIGSLNLTSYNGTARKHLARINTNGTLDTSFDPGTGFTAETAMREIKIQPDGKVLVAGAFGFYQGVQRRCFVRINTNGTVDAGFVENFTIDVYNMAIQTDGKIIISSGNSFVRVNSDGTTDASFTPLTGTGQALAFIVPLSTGKILIGGKIERLYADGTKDYTFNYVGTGAENSIRAIAVQGDGKIIIGGDFHAYASTLIGGITRLNSDGSLDPAFTIGTGANGSVQSVRIQSDGKIIVTGSFTTFNGAVAGGIVRLNSNGTVDSGFNTGAGADNVIYQADVQSDGKVIIVGAFTLFDGTAVNRIARLNSNGSFDSSFGIGSGADNSILTVKVQTDDKILVAGSFITFNGVAINRLVRLSSDGSIDTGFNVGTGIVGSPKKIKTQSDGKIILSGVTSYNGISRNGILRLLTTGAIDASFVPATSGISIFDFEQQFDGKIIIGGGGSSVFLARLNSNGTLDATFNTGTGPNNIVYALALQSDAKILIVGEFNKYDVVGKNRIARLLNSTLSTGIINGSPFCVGATVTVPYFIAGNYNVGNVFTAQLSDASGSFASPVNLGSISSIASGTITVTIPNGTLNGIGYRIRVASSNPVSAGTDNQSDLIINELPTGTISGQSNVNCYNGSNGSATVAPADGHSPYIYFWAPFGGFNPSASNLPAGIYTVTITDSRNCQVGIPVNITQPNELQLSLVSQTNVSCYNGSNGNATISAVGGSGGNSYLWSPGGQTGLTANNLSALSYIVQAADLNGCTDNLTVNISQPSQLTASISSSTNTTCSMSADGFATSVVSGGASPYTYSWSPIGGNNLTASNLIVGTYTLNALDANSCAASASVQIQHIPVVPEICSVTVDDFGDNNLIYWDKTQYQMADTFFVYRDTSNNAYGLIGKVPYDSLSQFIDTLRSLYGVNAGDPEVASWRYKIAFVDTCGDMSSFSPFHQTLFMQNTGANFTWNHYEIEGQPTPVPSLQNYLFMRDDVANGNYVLNQTLSASSLAYTDPTYAAIATTADWRVETLWSIACTPTMRMRKGNDDIQTVVVRSKSNIKNNRTVGIKDGKNQETRLKVYPNPATEMLNVEVSLNNATQATITIENMLGQQVHTSEIKNQKSEINISTFVSGVYFVKLAQNGSISTTKLIIQK